MIEAIVFYWQTDRKISIEEITLIWKDRHSATTNDELFKKINSDLKNDKLKYIEPFDINAQTSDGSANQTPEGAERLHFFYQKNVI